MSSEVASISGVRPVKQAVIDHNAASSAVIVSPVLDKSIRVISLILATAASVVVTFEEGTGQDLTGGMTVNGVLTAESPSGLFWTAPSEGLNMLLGGIVQTSGVITYIEV